MQVISRCHSATAYISQVFSDDNRVSGRQPYFTQVGVTGYESSPVLYFHYPPVPFIISGTDDHSVPCGIHRSSQRCGDIYPGMHPPVFV